MIADGSLQSLSVHAPTADHRHRSLPGLGIGFGIGMGLSRAIEWFSLPIFIVLQAAPMAAIIPLITYMYGIGIPPKYWLSLSWRRR